MDYPQRAWTSLSLTIALLIEGLTSTELFHPYDKLLPVRNNNKSQITGHLFTLLISFSAHTLQ